MMILMHYLTYRLGEKVAWRPTHFSEYQVFSCIFHLNLAMATLGLKEMGKFLWEGREYGGERNGHWIEILISITSPGGRIG